MFKIDEKLIDKRRIPKKLYKSDSLQKQISMSKLYVSQSIRSALT